MQVLRAYKVQVEIKGLMKDAIVCIETDHDEPDYEYWDELTARETKSDLALGKVMCCYLRVSVKFTDLDGFEGSDSLGQCFARPSVDAFAKDITQTVKDHQMVQIATNDLLERVLQGIETLNTFLKAA